MNERELEQYLYEHIPLSIAMQISVIEVRDAGAAKLPSAKKMIAALERLQAAHESSALPKQMVASGYLVEA